MKTLKNPQKPIGGYLGLELPDGTAQYADLLHLNTGRNALEYILIQKKYTKIYLPYFTCEVLLEPVVKLGITHQFYHIDHLLEPILDFKMEPHSCLLYTNYFGIKQKKVEQLSHKIGNLIIDNCQAFFSKPLPGINTFYSCRKFFGVPDGAYLQIKRKLPKKLKMDISVDRCAHLLKNIDISAEAGYADSIANNKVLECNPILTMSNLTQRMMTGIDYEHCARIRARNFNFLHKYLKEYNLLKFDIEPETAPMVYPLLVNNKHLKVHLIQKKIYVATYWPNVFKWTDKKMYENYLALNLTPLPIDQRYTLFDMKHVLDTLLKLL